MDFFTQSIYSDGTQNYVDNPTPKLSDNVTIKLSMLDDDVAAAFLLRIRNGAEEYHEMKLTGIRGKLAYYEPQWHGVFADRFCPGGNPHGCTR